MSDFDSLTLALEGWFDTSICNLPDELRQRVKREFIPMSWDQLSAEDRRSIALQMDSQHDPATERDRQFWWDFFGRQDALKAEIAQWEAVATPTASDLALSEDRLRELRQELARMEMELQKGLAPSDHRPVSNRSDGQCAASRTGQDSTAPYVAYPEAMQQLVERLDATPEELAAWVLMGSESGGLSAYLNINESDPPPRFRYGQDDGIVGDDYLSPLMTCWFRVDEIAEFHPEHRYITGSALLKRWSNRPGLHPAAFILEKIEESRLLHVQPVCGMTHAISTVDASCPSLTTGLFRLSEVEAIEAEGFGLDREPGVHSGSDRHPRGEQAISLHADDAEVEGDATSAPKVDSASAADVPMQVNSPTQDPIKSDQPQIGSAQWRSQTARAAANARHDRPGGSRDKKKRMQDFWASGKYSTRDICAEQECSALGMSFASARKALRNMPDPTRS